MFNLIVLSTFSDIESRMSIYKINFKLHKATFGKLITKLGYKSVREKVNGKPITYYNISVDEEALKRHILVNYNDYDAFAEAEFAVAKTY